MTIHELKVWPEFYLSLEAGEKNFELRKNDRNYKPGDILILKEFCPDREIYSGAELKRKIVSIWSGSDLEKFGLMPGFCILQL